MIRYGLVITALILFALTWGAQRVEIGRNLRVAEINTRAFLCDGVNRELPTNLRGVRIRKVVVWFGAYGGTNADIVFSLEKIHRDGRYESIAKAGWDHYAEPTSVSGQVLTYDFAPDWIRIGKEQDLKLYYECNPMNEETKTKKAHIIVLVYYLGEGRNE